MLRKPSLFLLMLFIGLSAHAQDDARVALGKVMDVITLKGIPAHIQYASMPTGSISGEFADSTFSFTFFGMAKYRITAEAEGYGSRTVLLDPKEVGDDKTVVRNITLIPEAETVRLSALIFEQGQAKIAPSSYAGLDGVVSIMKEHPRMVIQLEGHTDNIGSPEANLRLSESRVEAVRDYIVSKGIARSRIRTKAFGGTQPLNTENTPEARNLNRRVELRILRWE